ncbi:class II aldolase/adducin family protein [Streptomyces sp. NPDC004609]|uniref:class II aldolase/adducin family protein n=1 Tax=Streptomyces sp. NPDC004609 TaxID=3364704 RepID=UPI0036A745A5
MTPTPAQRELIARACRVLTARGLADGVLGHISLRIDENTLLVRCRGPQERGLASTTAADVHWVDLDGAPAAVGELADGYTVPNELPLHTELLRRRPEVNAVLHAHPSNVVAADLAGLGVRPILGSFDIPGAHLAAGGVPVYARAVLVRSRTLATEVCEAMGDRPVVVMRGHGLTSVADTVERAVLQAVSVDTISRFSLQVASAGGTLVDIAEEDWADLPDLGGSFNVATSWRHELARLHDCGC